MAGPLNRPNPSPSTSRPRRPSSTTAPATGSTWTTSSGSGFEEWPRYSIGRTASLSSCTECGCAAPPRPARKVTGRVCDPVGIAEGPTAIDAATQCRHFGFRLRLVDNLKPSGGAWQRPRREDGKRRVFALHTAQTRPTPRFRSLHEVCTQGAPLHVANDLVEVLFCFHRETLVMPLMRWPYPIS